MIYSVPSVLQQVLGTTRKQAYNMQFTEEELIELIEKINREKENVARANYGFVSTRILERVSLGRSTTILGGYTLEAVQKIVEEYKKDKNKEREEK